MKELIYDYLLNNCVGYDNRIKGWQLMKLFNIKDHKTLRGYIQELRNDEVISSEAGSKGGYYIPKNDEEFERGNKSQFLRGQEMLNTYYKQKRKYLQSKMNRMENL